MPCFANFMPELALLAALNQNAFIFSPWCCSTKSFTTSQSSQRCRVPILVQDNAFNYDKGVLAEILEPIMGKGLIPADLETWKPRRRAIVPAFHKAYLQAMQRMFCDCTRQTLDKFERLSAGGKASVLSSRRTSCPGLKDRTK